MPILQNSLLTIDGVELRDKDDPERLAEEAEEEEELAAHIRESQLENPTGGIEVPPTVAHDQSD